MTDAADVREPPAASPPAGVRRFLATRYRGEAPLGTVFWRDMIVIGSLINAAATLVAMTLIAGGVPFTWGMVVYFAPLPWNVFLFWAVWRSSDAAALPVSLAAKAAATVWLLTAVAL